MPGSDHARGPFESAFAASICGERSVALVVGTILTIINQGDVILGGDAATATWVKMGLNYCVPFIVSNLGLLAGKRAEAERLEKP